MEYIKPEAKSILDFKKGDIIAKIEPSPIEGPFGRGRDTTFIGQKLIFLGIANGCIYLERTTTIEKLMQGQTFFIPLSLYEMGWNYYEEPEFLKGKDDMISFLEKMVSPQSKAALEKIKKKAMEEENYELLAKVTKKLKEIERKQNDKDVDLDNPNFLFGEGGGMFGGILGRGNKGFNMRDLDPDDFLDDLDDDDFD